MRLFVKHNIDDYYSRDVDGTYDFFGLILSVYDCSIILDFFNFIKHRMVFNYNNYIDEFADPEEELVGDILPYAKGFEEFIEPDLSLAVNITLVEDNSNNANGNSSQPQSKVVFLNNKNNNKNKNL
jgi:hypothetical protein